MADSKITALTALTAADPVNDMFPVVDVSDTSMAASGTTKRISVNNILSSSPTASGNFTITGDLTVRTDKLKVTSSGVGFGVNPSYPVDVLATGVIAQFLRDLTIDTGIQIQADNSGAIIRSVGNHALRFNTDSVDRYVIDSTGISTWSVAGTTAMTLNSTGLGVGRTALTRLTVSNGSSTRSGITITDGNTASLMLFAGASGDASIAVDSNSLVFKTGANAGVDNGTVRMTLDSSGNVGVGITPSAWATTTTIWRALDMQYSCGLASTGAGSGEIDLLWNAYYDQTDQRWEFKYTGDRASRYSIGGAGVHAWYNTASTGTANNPITWTQAMTLDVSGNLLVKKTAISGSTLGCELTATGQVNGATAGLDNLNIYNTTASAYRFYVSGAGTVFATNTVISAISDARLKENVQDIDVGLAAILSLKPRKFDWKAGKGKDIKGDRGFIAQEFETVFPNLIDEWKDPAPEGEAPYKSVRADLIPVLVKAIQELTARVAALEA